MTERLAQLSDSLSRWEEWRDGRKYGYRCAVCAEFRCPLFGPLWGHVERQHPLALQALRTAKESNHTLPARQVHRGEEAVPQSKAETVPPIESSVARTCPVCRAAFSSSVAMQQHLASKPDESHRKHRQEAAWMSSSATKEPIESTTKLWLAAKKAKSLGEVQILGDLKRKLEEADENNKEMAAKITTLEAEAVQLAQTAFGQEVTDVDTGVTEIVIPSQSNTPREPAFKKVRRVERYAMAAVREGQDTVAKVKKEKLQVEEKLEVKGKEKEQVDEELEETQDNYQLQITFTDRLQSQIEELAALAEAHGASLDDINRIKNKYR